MKGSSSIGWLGAIVLDHDFTCPEELGGMFDVVAEILLRGSVEQGGRVRLFRDVSRSFACSGGCLRAATSRPRLREIDPVPSRQSQGGLRTGLFDRLTPERSARNSPRSRSRWRQAAAASEPSGRPERTPAACHANPRSKSLHIRERILQDPGCSSGSFLPAVRQSSGGSGLL